MHPNNKHNEAYNFDELEKVQPELSQYIIANHNDEKTIDKGLVEDELIQLLSSEFGNEKPSCLVLECTNLPPYKQAIRSKFEFEIFDILSAIERKLPKSIKSEYL